MAIPGWQKKESPFHQQGERDIHEKLGYVEHIETVGRQIIRDFLTEQHENFFARLSYALVGSLDADGNPWASMLVGEPGFIAAPSDDSSDDASEGPKGPTSDHRTLRIEAQIPFGDPLANHLAEGADIGFLGIELHTRRRNRVNGVVSAISNDGFYVQVTQTFGNCPKYIQARQFDLKSFNLAEPKPSYPLRLKLPD